MCDSPDPRIIFGAEISLGGGFSHRVGISPGWGFHKESGLLKTWISLGEGFPFEPGVFEFSTRALPLHLLGSGFFPTLSSLFPSSLFSLS